MPHDRQKHLVSLILLMVVPMPAFGYIGPGSGLSGLGSLLALLGAVLFAIVGFIWYPAKRLLRLGKRAADKTGPIDPPKS
jgi:hypothetical protein